MSLNFNPQTEEQVLNLLPDGEYPFYVYDAENWIGKTGKESIKLTLKVIDQNGAERSVFCYLSPNYLFLLKHFCDAVGLQEAYQKGNLDAGMCMNMSGKCKIITEDAPVGSPYPPKSVVKDFIKGAPTLDAMKAKPKTEEKSDFVDSDIPF